MKPAVILLTATIAFCDDWDAVQRIAPDHKLEVVTKRNRTRGIFVMADDTVLVLRHKSGEASIQRADIRRVLIADPAFRIRHGLLSVAIGAGVGLAVGVAICPYCANEGSPGKYTVPLTSAGAALGGLGFLPEPYRTVYKR